MALDVFSSVRSLFKPEDFTIDNIVFKLHYRVSVILFLGSSLVGVAKQYFGDPINCQTASGVSSKVLDDYCWIHSTFHLRNEYQGNVGCIVDSELLPERTNYIPSYYEENRSAQSMVRTPSILLSQSTPDTSFYQWVPFTLLLQAILFYVPRKIWKSCEGGLIESFGREGKRRVLMRGDVEGALEHGFILKDDLARKYSAYFLSILHHNNGYFIQYLICEVLNFLISVGNIYLTDYFLGGRFIRYGTRVVRFLYYDQIARLDMPNPFCTVFPTITSCTFHTVGSAAGEQKFNSLCILSLNIINEKVYLLLWFWMYFLTVVSGVHLFYRLLVVFVPPLRYLLILCRTRGFSRLDSNTAKNVLSHCYLGDWFVLYQLSKNSNTYFFRYLLRHLDKAFTNQAKNKIGRLRADIRQEESLRRSVTNGGSEDGRRRKYLEEAETLPPL
ncbi:innexin inx2 [Eurytemora carolleeae]|uniref:innexin inx2 n=1 Tax=Eurytemora carolleeae TaxID=1294199 RepID=UPI000C786E36|nr:innexin inx2 [Eurytemora carolleeae]|eukprot:XP_023346382.1 innexin inx2-like [Eurytemora affinis]